MKQLAFLFLLFSVISYGNDKKTTSTIKHVTIYRSGAEIQRTTTIVLKEGTQTLLLAGLSPNIDESSIQLSGLFNATVVAMNFNINYLENTIDSEELTVLKKQLATLQLDKSILASIDSGLQEELKLIAANKSIAGENNDLSLEKLKAIATYYRTRVTEIKKDLAANILANTTLIIDIRALKNEIKTKQGTLASKKKKQGVIKLKLNSDIPQNLKLTFNYTVSNAGWFPSYDIKTKSLSDKLLLKYKANIYQQTGNNWDNVAVTLSTGNPKGNAKQPTLSPKYLNFTYRNNYRAKKSTSYKGFSYNPMVKHVHGTIVDSDGQPLPGANIIIKGTTIGTQTDFDGNYSLAITEGQELMVSYIGFKSIELPLYSTNINLQLEDDAQALDEVVVTAYGTKKEHKMTYATAIVGNVSGVTIRGSSSIRTTPKPIYIIDGIIVSTNEYEDFNPELIESIQVLKGNEATSLYGNNAVGGATVISTKGATKAQSLTTTVFKLNKKQNILSNNDVAIITIDNFSIATDYEYYSAPILNETVFLTASLTDWGQYNLLPGEANIYVEGRYAGKTVISPKDTNKKLLISLGEDENIVVTRIQTNKFKSSSFTGSNKIVNHSYEITLKNNRATAITVKLWDRIPISQNKEIKVSNIDTETADYDKETGLVTWKLTIPANQSAKKQLSYQVKYPKGKRVNM